MYQLFQSPVPESTVYFVIFKGRQRVVRINCAITERLIKFLVREDLFHELGFNHSTRKFIANFETVSDVQGYLRMLRLMEE